MSTQDGAISLWNQPTNERPHRCFYVALDMPSVAERRGRGCEHEHERATWFVVLELAFELVDVDAKEVNLDNK